MKAIRAPIHLHPRTPSLIFALLVLPILLLSCSDDSTAPDDGEATITGKLLLPDPAPDRQYIVMLDDDLDGRVRIDDIAGNCCAGTEIPYEIPDVATGDYYVYAFVRLVSAPGSEPETGDLYGVYGGTQGNWPASPNVRVPASGSVTCDLVMNEYHAEPEPSDQPVITWNPPNLLMHYNYSGGCLVSGTTYMGGRCTGADGDVEVTVRMYRGGTGGDLAGETSAVLPMTAGETFWLGATVLLSGDNHLNPYAFVWSSPNAAVSCPVTFYLANCWARSIHGPFVD